MAQYFATEECELQVYFAGRVQLGQIAVVYCRVSTSDQNCERRETDLIVYAAKAGYVFAGVWKATASGSNMDRQQRQHVLKPAQARKIEVISVIGSILPTDRQATRLEQKYCAGNSQT